MSEMAITHESLPNNRLVVRIGGILRPRDAEDFDTEIQRISEADPEVVILDMEKLDFIGSAGLGALVRLDKAMRKQETRVRVVNANANLQMLFKQSRLDEHFPFFDSLDQAIA